MKTYIPIFSPSFSGSTLLDLMLGASPDCFCSGEIWAVFHKAREERRAKNMLCQVHGTECTFWASVKDKVTPENLFQTLCEASGMGAASDSSKDLDWYRKQFSVMLDARVRIVPLVLSKNLMDFAASYVSRKPGVVVSQAVTNWRDYYTRAWQFLSQEYPDLTPLVVRYEELTTDPGDVLRFLCEYEIGIAYDDLMLTPWGNDEAHLTYGNRAATLFREKDPKGFDRNFARGGAQIAGHYRQNHGRVFYHADKYKTVLSETEQAYVQDKVAEGVERLREG